MAPIVIAAIAAGVTAVAGLVGYLIEQDRGEEAAAIMELARREYENLSVPKFQEIAAEVLGPTAFARIQTDPAYRVAQNEALDKLRAMEEGGGFMLEDHANLNRVQSQLARQESSSRAAITEQMNARGVGGSGAELAMALSNSQAAADRGQQAGLEVAAQAQRRYFDAVRARGDLAGRLRAQDWGEQAEAARAQDAIDRFNLGHRYDVARYNNDLQQQQFQNQMALADRRYGAARDRASFIAGQGQNAGQTVAGVGGAIGNGMHRYGGHYASQPATGNVGGTQYGGGYDDLQPAESLYYEDKRKR